MPNPGYSAHGQLFDGVMMDYKRERSFKKNTGQKRENTR